MILYFSHHSTVICSHKPCSTTKVKVVLAKEKSLLSVSQPPPLGLSALHSHLPVHLCGIHPLCIQVLTPHKHKHPQMASVKLVAEASYSNRFIAQQGTCHTLVPLA